MWAHLQQGLLFFCGELLAAEYETSSRDFVIILNIFGTLQGYNNEFQLSNWTNCALNNFAAVLVCHLMFNLGPKVKPVETHC